MSFHRLRLRNSRLRRRPLIGLPSIVVIVVVATLSQGPSAAMAGPAARSCVSIFLQNEHESAAQKMSSFNDVLAVMERAPYDPEKMAVIPLQMWRFIGKRLSFFVAKRSKEILNDRRDFRESPMEKPIHPMGVGLVGRLKMHRSNWTGVFAGGEFPVLARASISQGNPFKLTPEGRLQPRSTAMAIKVFESHDPNQKVKTANAVFQNDLNGLLGNDGRALNYLQSPQTNQPNLDVSRIRQPYEFLTLLGVAFGSFSTPQDKMRKFPFINPQIRPVHSLAEVGVSDPSEVRTPTWVQIRPRLKTAPVESSDFRLEISETLARDSALVYDLLVSDFRDDRGQIQWVTAGELVFERAILSEGVDKNLLFSHDRLNSDFTAEKFVLPDPSVQYRAPYDDIQ